MKKFSVLILAFLVLQFANAQVWQLQNPLPQESSLHSVHFPDSLTGYAVGDYSTIMKTVDGGLTWTSLASISDQWLSSVYFTSKHTGYVVGGYDGTIFKTTDGGNSWSTLNTGITNNLYSIYFTDSITGFAVGSSIILKTTDGGTNWSAALSGSVAGNLYSICFPDKNTGYAAGNVANIVKTTDGGMTWNLLSTGYSNSGQYKGICFADTSTGFVAGYQNGLNGSTFLILNTNDGGLSWDTIMKGKQGAARSISCTDKNNVFVCGYRNSRDGGSYGIIYNTTDGGLTWDSIPYETLGWLNSIYFPTHYAGHVVGNGGKIIRTGNGGVTWEESTFGATQNIYSLYFTDLLTGYGVGSNGTIMKTIDGGLNWAASFNESKGELESVYFSDKNNGYIAGSHGIILKTSDAGQTWTQSPGIDTNLFFYSICFPDHSTGYSGGYSWGEQRGNVVLKSVDAGATWNIIDSAGFGGMGILHNLYFFNNLSGFAAGGQDAPQSLNGGFILKTNDGGSSWTYVYNHPYCPILSIFFTSRDTGYAVGGVFFNGWFPAPQGIILKTINAGETWDTITTMIDIYLNSVYFTDKNTGFAVGNTGTVLKTTDAGLTWNMDSTCTKHELYSICFADPQTGYAAGSYGTIIQTTNAGTGIHEGSQASSTFTLYPNPCASQVTIKFLPIKKNADASLTLYSVTGQCLIRKEMPGSTFKLDVSSLPSGVYIVTYISGEFTETTKLLKE
jgi:photosystem II stability/assembly factor-like uncharacterized protein